MYGYTADGELGPPRRPAAPLTPNGLKLLQAYLVFARAVACMVGNALAVEGW